jgi:hypothetical protein
VTALLPAEVVSSSTQVTTFLPAGTVSSSTQLPSGIASSSAQVIAYLPTDTVSSSQQVTAFLPINTVSSSGQVSYTGLSNIPSGIASSSGQIKNYLPTDTVSSSVQVTTFLPANTVSSSGQISLSGISGTTFSNNDFSFPLNVTVNGLLTATSQSIIYITSSQLNVGSNDIILNTSEQLRYGGLTVFDSGSANQSGSLFWDSLHNVWLYVHAGTSNTSSIVITGPENTGVLGSETFLTPNLLPKAGLIGDHIVDSQISDNGTTVGMTGNLSVTGSLTVATNALFVSSSGNVGIGTTSPFYKLVVSNGGVNGLEIDPTNASGTQTAILSYNRSTSAYTPLIIQGLGVTLGHPSYPFTITTSGSVGIGTTDFGTNQAKLLVGSYVINGSAAVAQFNGFIRLTSDVIIHQDGATGNSGAIQYGAAGLIISSSLTGDSRPILLAGGNVGIGTTNPAYLLDVQKSDAGNVVDFRITNTESANAASGTRAIVQTNGASAGDPRLVLSVAGVREYSLGIDNSDSDKFKITDGSDPSSGTNYLTIDTSGNVSLGLSSASEKLLVYTNADSRNKVRIRNDSSGSSARAELIVNAYGNSWGLGMGSTANNSNAFYIREDPLDADTVRVSILTGGNVGIGTTNPAARLHVANLTLDNSAYQHITYFNAHNSDESSGEAYDTTKPSFGIGFRRQWNGGPFTNLASIHGFGSGNWRGGLLFRTKNNTSSSGEPDINAMILSPAGNVGIGTTNPNNLLTLRGASAQVDIQSTADSQVPGIFMRYIDSSTAGTKIYYSTGDAVTYYDNLYSYTESTVYGSHDFRSKNASNVLTSRLYIRGNTGNIGIGTTNPAEKLELRSGYFRMSDPSSNAGAGYDIQWSSNNGGTNAVYASIVGVTTVSGARTGELRFLTSNAGAPTQRLTIGSTGNVVPGANGTQDLGSSSLRWSTVYTSDLSLSNGIGDWTIVEGEDDLFIYNNKNNKVYKFTLQEVDPATATPKKS